MLSYYDFSFVFSTFSEGQAYQRPKKKPLAERIAEKETQKKKEDEEKKIKEKVSDHN